MSQDKIHGAKSNLLPNLMELLSWNTKKYSNDTIYMYIYSNTVLMVLNFTTDFDKIAPT